MKKIKLTKGKYVIVDDEDFDWLNQWKWYCSDKGYAVRNVRYGLRTLNKKRILRMHRLINNTPSGFETDHINRNKLDNRRINLRTVTKVQNKMNTDPPSNNKSGHKGIWWDKYHDVWGVQIMVDKKSYWLGRFKNLNDAIVVRKSAENKYYTI